MWKDGRFALCVLRKSPGFTTWRDSRDSRISTRVNELKFALELCEVCEPPFAKGSRAASSQVFGSDL